MFSKSRIKTKFMRFQDLYHSVVFGKGSRRFTFGAMLWIVIALHSAWCFSTGAINLNPFSAFTDVGFEPMTEFSVNQGIYIPNTPSAIYPYLSDDSFSSSVGLPSLAGFKYPFSTYKTLTTAGSSVAPMGLPSDVSTSSKPKTGPGGKSPNSYVKNGNENRNGYMNGNGDRSKNGQRSVTLDVRGGGYKLENSKSKPYKAPSAESMGHDILSQRRPSHGGRGNADSRTRSRRPNKKSQRNKGASMKNPYFNMKYETQPSSLPTNMEFESPDSVLPMVPSSLFYLRQQKSKLNPYLSLGNSADVLQSMMNYPFSPTATFGGIKSMPSLYGSVKSAASQLLRGRASSALQSTLNSATLGALGFGFPFQSASGSAGQLASQLSLLQPSLEGAFGIASPLGGDILFQDPSFYAALAQTAAGRNLLRQTYQQQMGSTKSSPTLPFLQHQAMQQAITPGLKLEPQTANPDATALSVGANPETLYGSSYTRNYIQGNQAGMHMQPGNIEPSQISDYQQMLYDHQQEQQQKPQNQLQEQHLQEQQQLQQHQQLHQEHLQQEQLQQQQLRQKFQQQQLQQQLQQQQIQQHQRFMNEKQTAYSSPHNFSPTYPERGQLTDQRFNIPDSTTTNSAQQAYTETQMTNKEQMGPYAHYPHENPGDNSYQRDPQRQPQEYSQAANSKYSQNTQATYNDPNHGLPDAYQSDHRNPYSQSLNYPSQHHADYITNYPTKEQTESQQTSNPSYLNENAPQRPSYSPNLESLPAYPPQEYSNQMAQPNYQSPSNHEGVSYPLPDSKQVSDYANNYASPEHTYYHQSGTLQQNSNLGFPINVPGVQNISPPDPTNSNERLFPSSTMHSDHKEGNDRAALHLPKDMSIFVSQNSQMKQAFEKLSGFYEQSKYYNPDSINDSNENDDYSALVNTRIQGESLNSNQNDNSRKSSSEESKKIPTKLPLHSKSGNISTSSSYKLAASDHHVKGNKAAPTSSYMIPFSTTDKTEVRTSSPSKPQSHSHTKTSSSSRKSSSRKYHIPVPAKSSTESQERSSSVADTNEDTPFCARHANTTYCQHDPEYPRDEIKQAIEKNRHPLDHFLVDISPSSSLLGDASKSSSLTYNIHGNVMSEVADAFNNSRCKSNAFYAKPLRAINTSGQWKVIVNVELGDTGTNYTQMVRFDECSHQDGASSVCGLNPNASCLQQYKLYRLLAWDKIHGFFIDAFLLPISCACGNSFSIKSSAV